jgi:dTDP-4-dehydrorhamnose reductase
MKVAILGSNGQLGSDLVKEFIDNNDEVIQLTHNDFQVEDYNSVHRVLASTKPGCILNTTAFHVVPQCEANPLKAFEVNALGSLNVAKVSDILGSINLYYSTDYVFDGKKRAPYLESDLPNPLNIYASTKLLGEYYTLNYSQKAIVLRVSGIYGRIPCRAKGGNFITTMLKVAKEKAEVKVVKDEILTPSPTKEIAKKTFEIVRAGANGLFHLTCEGECSWYEFARVIFETLHLKTTLIPCSVYDFPTNVKRPFYSVLENKKLKELRLHNMSYWKDALVTFLNENYL